MSNTESRGEIRVGLSPETRARRQEEALEAASEKTLSTIREWREYENQFAETYGDDLMHYTKAFFGQNRHTGRVHFRNDYVRVSEILPEFTTVLSEAISDQPEDARAEWLLGYFEEASNFERR